MLQKLVIKNIALIDNAEINFTDGLNVLSGETGSGKSVILESLNFVLGAKADKSLIRTGEVECFVRAEFDVSSINWIKDLFLEFDFDQDDLLIITRKFNLDGKSSIKINGNNVTVGMLKKFSSGLVDIHGQSEHFYLLNTANQLNLLDRLGGDEVLKIKEFLKEKYSDYKKTLKELDELGGDDDKRLVRLDILNYQIKEIEEASLRDGEEDELVSIRQKLLNQEKIVSALNSVKSGIIDEGGVSDILSNITRVLSSINVLGAEYQSLSERLEAVYAEIDDVSSSVDDLIDAVDFGDYNIEYVEERLDLIKNLKRKYGNSFSQIDEFYKNACLEKEKLENYSVLADELLCAKKNQEQDLYNLYVDLSEKRRSVANIFAKNIIAELVELGITKGKFEVKFSDIPLFDCCKFDSSNGFDNIEFMFSANLGEPLKSLSSVISGGEMSRFMLSIKAQTAKYNDISTFIFDEIDAGISGIIARVVAEKFAKISLGTQVIAVSHLPQISAMADNNLLIVKTEGVDRVTTEVKILNTKEKVNEIVRLVGGDNDSQSAISHATEMIEKANEIKEKIKKPN